MDKPMKIKMLPRYLLRTIRLQCRGATFLSLISVITVFLNIKVLLISEISIYILYNVRDVRNVFILC